MYKPIENEIFHVHTSRCGHASDEEDYKYVEKAIELGAERIVFTDHAPFPGNPFRSRSRMRIEELDGYVSSIEGLKGEYGKNIEILRGLEIEYLPSFTDYYKELRKSGKFDVLILGQHMYEYEDGSMSFHDEDRTQEFIGMCDAMIAGANTGLFDVIAHPDRAFKRCKVWDKRMMQKGYDVIFAARNNNVLLEKNYSSMQHKYRYWEEFWTRAGGMQHVYGYDAHSVEEMESIWNKNHRMLTQMELNQLLGHIGYTEE